MSYLVLARKWRPQTWDDVVAQDHVSATLRNAIEHNRLAHAYLFTGPRGVGKTSAARILAKALNCETGPTPTPCNACSNCQEIAEGRHVDVFEIDGASNRGIDEVRSLRENIRYTPARGKFRVYIIDEVHMLTNEAFNALLKTLEEPPEHVVFIFATTEPQKVPATILSRCQRFDFRRIGTQDIAQSLKRICQSEGIEIDDDALLLIARKADGSLRDSQSILDQMISFSQGRITADEVIQGLGLIEREVFFEVTDVIRSKSVPDGLALVEKLVSRGYDLEEFLTGLTEHFRNFLVAGSTGSAELVDASENHAQRYLKEASLFPVADLLRLIRLVADTRHSVKRHVNPRLPLEVAMVKMIKMDSAVSLEALIRKLDGGPASPTTPSPRPVPPPRPATPPAPSRPSPPVQKAPRPAQAPAKIGEEPAPTAQASPGAQSSPVAPASPAPSSANTVESEITLETVSARWEEIIAKVKHKKITVGSFLHEGVLTGLSGNHLELAFRQSNTFHIDAIKRADELVTQSILDVLGVALKLKCVKKDDLPPREVAMSTRDEKKAYLDQLMEKDDNIRNLMNEVGGEIVE